MLLQFMAFNNGFGKVSHNLHVAIRQRRARAAAERPVAAVTGRRPALLPHGHPPRQVIVLFCYTVTGLWKVFYGLWDLTTAVSVFEIDRLLVHHREPSRRDEPGNDPRRVLHRNELVGWLLFTGTMYLESASLLVAPDRASTGVWGPDWSVPPWHSPGHGDHLHSERVPRVALLICSPSSRRTRSP